jgi:hypothetical protein
MLCSNYIIGVAATLVEIVVVNILVSFERLKYILSVRNCYDSNIIVNLVYTWVTIRFLGRCLSRFWGVWSRFDCFVGLLCHLTPT